ncbi:MAG: outer membrane protein assembly factor BamD [Planctomycetaceae bacterium]
MIHPEPASGGVYPRRQLVECSRRAGRRPAQTCRQGQRPGLGQVARGALAAIAIASCVVSAGCESTLLDQKVEAANIFGPIGRRAREKVEMVQRDPNEPLEGSDELDAAKKLFDEKEYHAAAKTFHKVAVKYKDKPVEEEAMFLEAESYFHMQHFPDAQDAYDDLFKKHPGTRYLDKSVGRLYDIARYWLNSPKPVSQVELAAFSKGDPDTKLEDIPDARVPFTFPLTPNLFDRTRPLFDTQGNALKALKSVWMNDPSGPLADEALMLYATHKLRKGDYREAESFFGTIRETYSDSEHAPAAYFLGQHASHMSYQGARYDGKQLAEARKLTESALRLFPDRPETKKLQGDLEKIKREEARREWIDVQFYLKRQEKDAAAVCAEYILRDFPDSPEAAQAKALLMELGPDYSQGILPIPLHKPQATPVDPYDPVPTAAPEKAAEREPGRVFLSDEAESLPEEE